MHAIEPVIANQVNVSLFNALGLLLLVLMLIFAFVQSS
jgi:hypothetical protein